jgi:hypothetical protein
MPVSPGEFQSAYPTLFHITLAKDLDQVMRHGLLSTSALLDLCEVRNEQRYSIESTQRPKAIPISHHVHGEFLINDQAPMNVAALSKCLTDLSTQDWCESLNSRIFFWPTRERLAKHIGARLAEGRRRIVLSLETESLFRVLDVNSFELSPINSGNTMRKAAPRGSETFLKFSDYPFHERRRARGPGAAVAEVTYPYAITPAQLASVRLSADVLD